MTKGEIKLWKRALALSVLYFPFRQTIPAFHLPLAATNGTLLSGNRGSATLRVLRPCRTVARSTAQIPFRTITNLSETVNETPAAATIPLSQRDFLNRLDSRARNWHYISPRRSRVRASESVSRLHKTGVLSRAPRPCTQTMYPPRHYRRCTRFPKSYVKPGPLQLSDPQVLIRADQDAIGCSAARLSSSISSQQPLVLCSRSACRSSKHRPREYESLTNSP